MSRETVKKAQVRVECVLIIKAYFAQMNKQW